MDPTVTHVGFSDESHWNIGRFRSLGLVTTPSEHLDSLETRLRQLLDESHVSEFKWQRLRGAKERFAAEKMVKFAVENACAKQLRIDVLIWDIQDSRHAIVGRDDVANLQRMYYHLFRNVLRLRWPDGAVWRLYPDEHTAMDWESMEDYLSAVSVRIETERSLLTKGRFRFRIRQEFGIDDIVPSKSRERPLLQLADLFAGLAVFSREKFDAYQVWLSSSQNSLFENEISNSDPSHGDRERFQVLRMLDRECKQRRIGVSLKTKCGLWTPNPEYPINFWIYEPQHEEDKAPTRNQA